MKITTSLENISSFGGLNFISTEFDQLEFPKLITSSLGSHSPLATYQYHDIIKNIWMILFSGGDCAEDIQTNLKSELSNVLNMKICSADSILRLQKELSLAKEIHLSKNNIENQFSNHPFLNKLNLSLLLLTQQLEQGKSYDLDFDNQFIACEKQDAKKGYKKLRGYFPGIATIGKNIVYLENRNGNCNVKFKQEETLSNVYKMLIFNNISIKRSRMDCGSFTKAVIDVVQENSELFYIRSQRCSELNEKIKTVKNWEKVTIGFKEFEVASVNYIPFNANKSYRYVVSREANKSNQIDAFQGDSFIYRAIITNDNEMSDQEVVFFYNQRGGSEKIFDEMNNDFGWGNLPFSFLEENTVYMLITAMCRNFYLYFLEKIAHKIPFIEKTFRLKKFIFRFVIVPYKWIKKGGQKTLKLFTNKPYELLI